MWAGTVLDILTRSRRDTADTNACRKLLSRIRVLDAFASRTLRLLTGVSR